MISHDIIQAAVIAKLRASAALLAVTADIRELGYQGTDFTYPNVRLQIQAQEADLDCATLSLVTFSLYAYSDLPSSKECSSLVDMARRVLNNHMLIDIAQVERFMGLRMRSLTMSSPYRATSKVWRADVHFSVRVSEI